MYRNLKCSSVATPGGQNRQMNKRKLQVHLSVFFTQQFPHITALI